jgi:hypothetical protein
MKIGLLPLGVTEMSRSVAAADFRDPDRHVQSIFGPRPQG